MKVNSSFSLLNENFQKLRNSDIKNDKGSITPRTTSNRIVIDKIEISKISEKTAAYEKSTKQKINENTTKLRKELEQNQEKVTLLNAIIKIEDNKSDNYKMYTKNLDSVKSAITTLEEKINFIEKSKSIEIKELEGFSFITIYQENIKDSTYLSKDTPAVLHYGLNTESDALRNLVGSYIEKGILHPYEEVIFTQAFSYLQKVESAEEYIRGKLEYPNNIVVLDIFDRSSGFINSGNIQTHTIALWKKKNNEIVLIDPSQRSYSDHLLDSLKSKFEKISVSTLVYKTLYGVAVYKHNSVTGYSDYSQLKPMPRDCIDIAVKIGFELNEQQKLCDSLEKVEIGMLEQISNEPKTASHLIKLGEIVIRELQSSALQERRESKKIVQDVNEGLMNKITPKINIDKIKNYQNIKELKTAFTTIQKFV